MGKKYAKNPLLFIHQPKEVDKKVPMQHMYVTPKEKKESKPDHQETVKKSIRHRAFAEQDNEPQNESDLYMNDTDSEVEDKMEMTEEDMTEQSLNSNGDKQRFKDMSIEEKVNYFVNSPSYAPKLKCEIRTEGRNYRGVITGSDGNDVYVRVGNRSSSTKISLDDIKHIKLLGF